MATMQLAGLELKSGSSRAATASEAIGEGDAVYLTSGQAAIADATDANKKGVVGIAIQDASSGGQCVYALNGAEIVVSNTIAEAAVLFLDATGNVQLESDLTAADNVVQIGIVTVANDTIKLNLWDTGLVKT